ncbi:protein of unknown function [Paraburkholderia kururiensis]
MCIPPRESGAASWHQLPELTAADEPAEAASGDIAVTGQGTTGAAGAAVVSAVAAIRGALARDAPFPTLAAASVSAIRGSAASDCTPLAIAVAMASTARRCPSTSAS